MLQVQLIGNLGSDAVVKEHNGVKFISFNVAHTERYSGQDGSIHESTIWVSCAMNGDGGELLQYLVKGKQVFVYGRLSTRVYSSPKERRMVAGLNCSVDRIELIGGRVDDVPTRLYDFNGVERRVYKAYYVSIDDAKAVGAKKNANATLYSHNADKFSVDANGWIQPIVEQESNQEATETAK